MASRTMLRLSDHPLANPECTRHELQFGSVEAVWLKVKSVNQFLIDAPDPANATTMRDRTGSIATKPFILVKDVSFLVNVQ